MSGAAAGAPRPRRARRAEGSPCANCGSALIGDFCHACGQKSYLQHSLRDLFRELLESFVHFDGRIWRTLPPLALDPGKLSREWREGRRQRYLAPLPLFLFATFLLFAIPAVTGRQLLPVPDRAAMQAMATAADRAAMQAVATAGVDDEGGDRRRGPPSDGPLSQVGYRLGQRLAHISENNLYYSLKLEDLTYKLSAVTVPISMVILGMVMGFRRRFRFYDHAVVSLYGIAFLTLLIALATLFSGPVGRLMAGAALCIAPIHAVIHLRGAYGLSWPGAVLRGILMGALSVFAFALFFLGVFALGMFS